MKPKNNFLIFVATKKKQTKKLNVYDFGVPALFPLFAQSWAILMGPQWASHGPKRASSKSFLAFSIKTINCCKPKNNYLILDVTK